MKAVMISIKPKWCELIANGEKTIEVRKTRPKLEKPFKCYIYCTMGDALADLSNCSCKSIESDVKNGIVRRYALQKYKITEPVISSCAYGNGKVIGEFVCDRVDLIECDSEIYRSLEKDTCLSFEQFMGYCNGQDLYGWHISDLKIYDEPKEISEFQTMPCEKSDNACESCKYRIVSNTPEGWESECYVENGMTLTRPPQSWCYVESLEDI